MLIDPGLLLLFLATFSVVSITPGMCMILAMTLGISVGLRCSMKMMVGELIGVALVVIVVGFGLAEIFLNHPPLFLWFKVAGSLYLFFVGVQLWLDRGQLAVDLSMQSSAQISTIQLFAKGFITAIANPKGWAFFVALLPPFLSPQHDLTNQVLLYLAMILIIEFISLMIYALGGKMLRHMLMKANNVKLINRISGCLMIAVSVWLLIG